MKRPDMYENNGEGILRVYENPKWLVCIKNWKPDNDISGIAHLEIHHSTDEQFILAAGKAILITAEREDGAFKDICLTLMEQGVQRPRRVLVLLHHPEGHQNDVRPGFQLLYGEQRLCRPEPGGRGLYSGDRPEAVQQLSPCGFDSRCLISTG